MKTVWKYKIPLGGVMSVPKDSKPVFFGIQNKEFCLWLEVDIEEELVDRRFVIYGTGHTILGNSKYIQSIFDDIFVWHLYEAL